MQKENGKKEGSRHQELKFRTRWGWDGLSGEDRAAARKMAGEYMQFLNRAKTERESVRELIRRATAAGFVPLADRELHPGDRVFFTNRGRAVILAVIGQNGPQAGFNIVGAHVDAPRLDLKPQPLYEEEGLALLKTHYYGGIKKYQWLAVPLALHGMVSLGGLGEVELVLGEDLGDPVLTITDLLPHLAKEQMDKKMADAVSGEALNALVGGERLPGEGEEKEKVKLNILKLLSEKYGFSEEDFISADLSLVPAWPARSVGLDAACIGGYGQDDRVSVYTALEAVLGLGAPPARTALAVFCDKEEIGSVGNTGMAAAFFQDTAAEIYARCVPGFRELDLRRSLAGSAALSADVTAGYDPNYADAFDKRNVARIGAGVAVTKYTGSRGKSGASEASAEFVGRVRGLFNSRNISWQTGELGKVDLGGGGTIAYLLANHGMDVLDCGAPVLGMHSPFEVTSVVDVWSCYRAYQAFFETWV
ncbi:MAG: aminopeptidase [Peptococcaceae bacterium]|nr:aminopeptidase [Peptococcaceae bacterium]